MPAAARIAIVGAARTPIGKFGGALSKVPAVKLGAIAAAEALRRSQVPPKKVDEVIMGLCIQAGLGQNPARQVEEAVGLPHDRGAVTINKVCGSGMRAAMLAASEIRAGDVDIALVGGMESMSQAPYLSPRFRTGLRYGDTTLVDSVLRDSLEDAYGHGHMGKTADGTAKRNSVSREEQDAFALRSHQRSAKATADGKFRDEIVPVPPEASHAPGPLDKDE
ncbi:MAG: acetyl-CoA C-acyltransferase, partial [Euryarchaeota archaeon]|nr:acetyl-CoA C-acyltransferase [Euryarchaeota archaeon]